MSRTIQILITAVLIMAGQVRAQDIIYGDYSFVPNEEIRVELTEEDLAAKEVVLKDKRAIQFIYEDDQLIEYQLFHKVIRLNTSKAIEENNKVYIPTSSALEVVQTEARAINPGGKVTTLDKDDIQEAVDEESDRNYQYFAFEGIETGSIIEYYYMLKKHPSYYGSRMTLQRAVPVKKVEVEIFCPSNLEFTSKSYNGLPDMEEDTTYEDINCLKLHTTNLPVLKEEEFSAYEPNLMQVIYKLDANYYANKRNLINYAEVSQNLFEQIYNDRGRSDEKKARKLTKKMDLKYARDTRDKIRKVEHFIKTNYNVLSSSLASDEIDEILDNRIATEKGIVKLYTAIFDHLEIENQVVLTTNRFDLRFDPKFEAYIFLSEYLLYFPEIDDYLAPASILSRLGTVPFQWRNNYGLFIQPVSLGDIRSGAGKIKFIEPTPYDENQDKLDISVNFKNDFQVLEIDMKKEMTGNYALNYQPVYSYLNEEEKEDIEKSLVEFISEEADIEELEVENAGGEYFGLHPFKVDAQLTSSTFIEKAGPKYLFKVGELIGPQVEMYQEEKRHLGVENSFNRRYERKITFNIPDGYTIANLEDLNMDVYHEKDGERTMTFTSMYKKEGNKVVVTVEEYYKKIKYPIELFEEYRKVINAAADFNKIVLVLEQT